MDKLADVLGRAGAWAGQNKILSSIKNAFQTFMPLTIAGAVGLLWSNVLVNSSTGLGGIFPPIMVLDFLNPAFTAVFNATISCITLGVTYGIAQEFAEASGEKGWFPGIVGLSAFLAVTPRSFDVIAESGEVIAAGGYAVGFFGATGLFTGMILGLVASAIYCKLRTVEGLKVKMPEQVPPGVAKAFEVLVPAILTMIVAGLIGLASDMLFNAPINDVIFTYVQKPMMQIGSSLGGVIVIYTFIMLFWFVGIHGNNMLSAVKETLFTPLILENVEKFNEGIPATDPSMNIFGMAWLQMFGEFGGSGVTLGLVLSIFIFGRREDNRAIAALSVVPGIFNINETVTFGIPMVLNPILGIPFIIAPTINIIFGYVITLMGFCPKAVLVTPWTTPPILFGFLTTGGNWRGAVSQFLALVLCTVVYAPFLIAYEKYQNKQAEQA